jgi:hypothetical protein
MRHFYRENLIQLERPSRGEKREKGANQWKCEVFKKGLFVKDAPPGQNKRPAGNERPLQMAPPGSKKTGSSCRRELSG